MKKIKMCLMLIAIFIFAFGNKVLADDTCESSKKSELKELASQVSISYELIKPDKNDKMADQTSYSYDIIISNITKDIVVELGGKGYTYEDSKNGTVTISNIFTCGGYTLKANVYGRNTCKETILKRVKVKLPAYNVYSEFDECIGNENKYEICSPNTNTNKVEISDFYTTLEKEKEEYEAKQQKQKEKTKVEKKETLLDKTKELLPFVAGGLFAIIAIMVLIILIIKNKNKNKIKIDLGEKK